MNSFAKEPLGAEILCADAFLSRCIQCSEEKERKKLCNEKLL
jgi:hypothetical protein